MSGGIIIKKKIIVHTN